MIKKIKIKINDQNLVGNLFIPENVSFPTSGVIFYHGLGSSQKGYFSRAEALDKEGIISLIFDLRGHGDSEGDCNKITIKDNLVDCLYTFDYFTSLKEIDNKRIGLCGSSYGGYLAAIVSFKRSVKSMVLRAPAIYQNRLWNTPLGKLPSEEIRRFKNEGKLEKAKSILAISQFQGSLLIIKSEKDETIPKRVIDSYYQNSQKTKKKEIAVIKNATHSLENPKWNEEFIRLITNWFRKEL